MLHLGHKVEACACASPTLTPLARLPLPQDRLCLYLLSGLSQDTHRPPLCLPSHVPFWTFLP